MGHAEAWRAESSGHAGTGLVLIAEHEPEVAELASRYLAREGLDLWLTESPGEALAALNNHAAAMAVLDLTMPGLDARKARRALAAQDPRTRMPVIFLVGGKLRPSRPRAGTAGRERWLRRPFSPRTLVAGVQELLRTEGGQAERDRARPDQAALSAMSALSALGALSVDGAPRQGTAADVDIALTPAESALLAFMIRHAGRALTRPQLLAAMGGRGRDTGAVDVYICQLRAKLGTPSPIRTVRGTGYVVDVPVPLDPPTTNNYSG
jgi:DNA-binding response OmpR family regulator